MILSPARKIFFSKQILQAWRELLRSVGMNRIVNYVLTCILKKKFEFFKANNQLYTSFAGVLFLPGKDNIWLLKPFSDSRKSSKI